MIQPASNRGFTPYAVPAPPPGYYDPSLDAQQGAANRGLLDTTQDVGAANLRDTVDYGLGRDAIGRGFTRGTEDLGTQRDAVTRGYDRNVSDLNQGADRGLADLRTSAARGTEDHQSAIAGLLRRYGQLADSQRQQQGRAGVVRGGAMLQAAAKRQANQALDQQPLDQSFQRFTADNQQAQGRVGEDRTLGLGRLGEDKLTQLGALDTAGHRLGEDTTLAYGDLALKLAPPDANNPVGGRSFQNRTTQLTRAQRENFNFGLDVGAQKYYQAAGTGWTPPAMPSNEFVDATGNHRQLQTRGNQTVAVDPSGKVLWRRPRKAA